MEHGGGRVAEVLKTRGVSFLYTLCGGHISPILAGAKARGIRIIDVRDEKNAVFAADATARLTGTVGVAAVTAGPGLTNTLTALKNAQMAQSPIVLLGGAAATLLEGRGALQDINQQEVVKPHVKWSASVRYVNDLADVVAKAFDVAQSGVPGPVYVECPIDLLYPEEMIRQWYGESTPKRGGSGFNAVKKAAVGWYMERHVDRVFEAAGGAQNPLPRSIPRPPLGPLVSRAASLLADAERPLILVGAPAVSRPAEVEAVAEAVRQLGVPAYLTSAARGLLGRADPLQIRHRRRVALKKADLVILAGVPCDFRLDYGRSISSKAKLISIQPEARQTVKNRVPTLPVPQDVARFITMLGASGTPSPTWANWQAELQQSDAERESEIVEQASASVDPINPIALLQAVENALDDDATLVADGGDFVGTAAYVLRPRGPLGWLDPGPFGTLGVGAGFALASALARPKSLTWLIYGDGAAGFSLIEFDSFVRHQLPVIAVVGNDAGWSQIARDQVTFLGDDVGTVLARTAYHEAARGLGAEGLLLDDPGQVDAVLAEAKSLAQSGRPVLINAHIGRTEFRKGSISV